MRSNGNMFNNLVENNKGGGENETCAGGSVD